MWIRLVDGTRNSSLFRSLQDFESLLIGGPMFEIVVTQSATNPHQNKLPAISIFEIVERQSNWYCLSWSSNQCTPNSKLFKL
eukprot:s2016_g11.t1